MRMFPHYNGDRSRLSIQMSSVRARLFRNGAPKGVLSLMLPNLQTGYDHGNGWYVFYGTQHELMRVANYVQNRVDAAAAEENRSIRKLLEIEYGTSHLRDSRRFDRTQYSACST